MNSAAIISYARRLTWGVSASQISDTLMLDILNKAYKDFYKKVVNIDRNYFWDRWTTNIVANQYEYALTRPSGTTYGIFKPEKLRIKYVSTDDYIDVEFKDWDTMTETPEYYAVNQSTKAPFAVITDNKYIHIFPTPTANVTAWLLIEWAKMPYDLTATSLETEILIDPIYHEVIAYMMRPSIYAEMSLFDKKNDSLQEAELEIQKALKSMWILTTKAIRCKRPDLYQFE